MWSEDVCCREFDVLPMRLTAVSVGMCSASGGPGEMETPRFALKGGLRGRRRIAANIVRDRSREGAPLDLFRSIPQQLNTRSTKMSVLSRFVMPAAQAVIQAGMLDSGQKHAGPTMDFLTLFCGVVLKRCLGDKVRNLS
jgi:hypothetical protein